MGVLILTNGESAAEKLKALDFPDTSVQSWDDVLHDGPVLDCGDLHKLSERRASFIAGFAAMDKSDVLARFEQRDQAFLDALDYMRIELWFEHDLYDQLQLIQILSVVNDRAPHADVQLIQADTYLGELDNSELALLRSKARKVSENQLDYATRVWRWFTCSSHDLADESLVSERAPLLHVPAALQRLMKEYPDARTGLPLSLDYAIRPLLDGPQSIKTLFVAMQNAEPAKFMGDLSFAHLFDTLIQAKTPLVAASSQALKVSSEVDHRDYFNQGVKLSAFGRRVLSGEADQVRVNGIDRWIGGVHIKIAGQ